MDDVVVFEGGPYDGIEWITVHAHPVEHFHVGGLDITYADTGRVADDGAHVYHHGQAA